VRKPKARSWKTKKSHGLGQQQQQQRPPIRNNPIEKKSEKEPEKAIKRYRPTRKLKGNLKPIAFADEARKRKGRRRIKELLLLLSIVILRTVLAISTHLIKKASALEECQWPAAAGRSYVHLEIVVH
jgi:hypothetical protein